MGNTKADQRRRQMAKLAFQRLSEGKPLLRRELFSDPTTGQHLLELWEAKFLRYLENKGIICRPGAQKGSNAKYQVVTHPTPEALRVLELLLSEDSALGFLLFTNTDPVEVYAKKSNGVSSHNDEPPEEPVEEAQEEQEPEPPPADGLDLIAERLVLVLRALVYMRESLDKAAEREARMEQKLDRIMKELGVKDPEEGGG